MFREAGRDLAFAGFTSWNGHAIRILRPVKRIVRTAIVPPGPREERHLRDLGVARGHRDHLDSDDLLLFAQGDGATFVKAAE
jgi:hypothetical protein